MEIDNPNLAPVFSESLWQKRSSSAVFCPFCDLSPEKNVLLIA